MRTFKVEDRRHGRETVWSTVEAVTFGDAFKQVRGFNPFAKASDDTDGEVRLVASRFRLSYHFQSRDRDYWERVVVYATDVAGMVADAATASLIVTDDEPKGGSK